MLFLALLSLLLMNCAFGFVEREAQIRFISATGNPASLSKFYLCDQTSIPYGRSFGVDLYVVPLIGCKPAPLNSTSEYFAAFVDQPSECDSAALYSQLVKLGATLVFLQVKGNVAAARALLPKELKTPIFLLEDLSFKKVLFSTPNSFKTNIDVFFPIVSSTDFQCTRLNRPHCPHYVCVPSFGCKLIPLLRSRAEGDKFVP